MKVTSVGGFSVCLASEVRKISLFLSLAVHVASGILVPQPGTEPAPPALEVWSLKHWTTRQVPLKVSLTIGEEKTQKLGAEQTRRTMLPSSKMERNTTGAGFGDYQLWLLRQRRGQKRKPGGSPGGRGGSDSELFLESLYLLRMEDGLCPPSPSQSPEGLSQRSSGRTGRSFSETVQCQRLNISSCTHITLLGPG